MKNEKPEKELTFGEKVLLTVAFIIIVGVIYLVYSTINLLWT